MKKTTKKQPSFAPDALGHYGPYGGAYVPEVLIPALQELDSCFEKAKKSAAFKKELAATYENFVGRPTPLTHLKNLSKEIGGAQLYIKNEGLCHTGAHKINHCVGQAILARQMNKTRIIAETGAGQHGLATAAVCARFGLECIIYMGEIDVARQRPNVFWMEQLGAKVIPVTFGGRRLKDAVNAAIKDWITNIRNSHYLLGSALGPHPYPEINRYFQSIVGKEIKAQFRKAAKKLPDYVIACVGGGSNAIGAFDSFLNDPSVKLIGVEAGGMGNLPGENARRFCPKQVSGQVGIVEGYKSYWLLDKNGQVANTHSISAGLDYAGVGPLHAYLHDLGRVEYHYATDKEVIAAFKLLARCEGIFPALESAHALAYAIKIGAQLPKTKNIVVNLSGRGDKDIFIVAKHIKDASFTAFLKDYVKGSK